VEMAALLYPLNKAQFGNQEIRRLANDRLQARASRRVALQAVVRWHTRRKSDVTSDWSRPEPDIRLREEMGDDMG
jgi:hypothetical protein